MGEIRWLDETGDSRITWNPENEDQVDAAEAQFDVLLGKGYKAFRVKKDGSQGQQIKKFDAEAGTIIMTKGLVGG